MGFIEDTTVLADGPPAVTDGSDPLDFMKRDLVPRRRTANDGALSSFDWYGLQTGL